MKALVAIAVVSVSVGAAHAQQPAAQQPAPPQAPAGQTCMSQHVEAPGMSAAALITRGFDIKAAVPGGLWVQKDPRGLFLQFRPGLGQRRAVLAPARTGQRTSLPIN